MNITFGGSRHRLVLGAVALGGALLAGTVAPGRASAAFSVCGSDPVIMAGHSMQVSVATTIADDASDVLSIRYTVHLPIGSHVHAVAYSDDSFVGRETVLTYADNPPGRYTVDTLVTTGASGVSVQSVLTVQRNRGNSGWGDNPVSDTQMGSAGQDLLNTVDFQ